MKPTKLPLHIRTMVINIQDQMRDVAPKQKALPYFSIDTLTTDQALATIVTGIYWGVVPLRWGAQPLPNHIILHLLRQRRILAKHLLEKNQAITDYERSIDIILSRGIDLQVELDTANARADEAQDRLAATSEKLGEALAAKLEAEGRLEGAEQVCDSLRADLERVYTYRTDAIARAISAEARAAQAERMLTTLACRTAPSRPSLTQRIATFFGRAAQEIPA